VSERGKRIDNPFKESKSKRQVGIITTSTIKKREKESFSIEIKTQHKKKYSFSPLLKLAIGKYFNSLTMSMFVVLFYGIM
jgi:hypothetical protein